MDKYRVLLADSDNFFRSNIHRGLTKLGYEVVATGNAADAIELFRRENFDAAVVEVAIVPRDGLEVLRELKSRDPELPVILLTETRTLGSAAIGVRAGAFDYLVKPIEDVNRLAELLDRSVEERKAQPHEETRALVTTPSAATTAPTPEPPPQATPPALPEVPAKETPAKEIPAPDLLEAIISGKPFEEIASLLAEACARTLSAEHAAVLLARGDRQLNGVAYYGYADSQQAGREFASAVSEDFTKWVLDERVAMWRSPDGNDKKQQAGLPLSYGNEVLGVVVVYPTLARGEYDANTQSQLNKLVAQGSLAAQIAHTQDQVKALRPWDELTGLLNREHFFQQADREFRRSWRFAQPLAIITFDVDWFEKINALLAHAGGDSILKQIAGRVRPGIRSVDILGRIASDQFAIAMTMGTADNAYKVAERLRRYIAEMEITTTEGVWQVTATFGIAAYPRENCSSIYDLARVAEEAMRAAKRAGRNRVQVF
jgi:diguanylate cyclase (GGDEF)-like protein